MEAKPGGIREFVAKASGLAVFVAVMVNAPWLTFVASFAIFRLDPALAPDGFFVIARAASAGGGKHYVAVSWPQYPDAKTERGVQSYLLPEPAGAIRGPKTQFYFTVLENDAGRQLVQVRSEGMHESRARYEAYPDRVKPVAYGSAAWGLETGWGFKVPLYFLVILLAASAGVATTLCLKRLLRVPNIPWRADA